MEAFGLALLAGLLAALIATGLWSFGLTRLKPKIDISPVIAYADDEENGRRVYRVKIINKRRRTVANLRCEMDLLTPRNVKGGQVEHRTGIKLRTNTLILLPGARRKDAEFKNIFRFGTNEDLHDLWD